VARQIQERLRQEAEVASYISRYGREPLRRGGPFARLTIPKLGVVLIVVEGTTGDALKAGAGHYEGTPLPGRPGNLAIAGHRAEFGQPFRHLDKLNEGDLAILDAPTGRFTYRVVGPFDGHPNPWVTFPTDFTVLTPTEKPSMTLTTSDPPDDKTARLIVRLALVTSETE
jgi:sortase A